MIILDQDHFSIEIILSISEIVRFLTTSDKDVLRIGLSRMLEFILGRYLRMTCDLCFGLSERRDLLG